MVMLSTRLTRVVDQHHLRVQTQRGVDARSSARRSLVRGGECPAHVTVDVVFGVQYGPHVFVFAIEKNLGVGVGGV